MGYATMITGRLSLTLLITENRNEQCIAAYRRLHCVLFFRTLLLKFVALRIISMLLLAETSIVPFDALALAKE
jgi:hypothetical protein